MRNCPCLPLAIALLAACSSSPTSAEDASSGGAPASAATACDAPAHPFLAPNGASNIHVDAYMSDTYAYAGPPSADLDVVRKTLGLECASITFDAQGRIVSVCLGVTGTKQVVLLDPRTLEVLASWDGLPNGLSSTSFGGGGYFYLDAESRAVIPTLDGKILRLALVPGPAFATDAAWDLFHGTAPLTVDDGSVESALPDWSGRIWFVTEKGAVGFVDPDGDDVRVTRLAGETIGNSFAVDETGGVFVVSDHALYRFDVDASGAPAVTWRKSYDRGTRLKPGQVNFGSGTTPTLFGDGWIAITDNADPRMHVVVYERGRDAKDDRRLCEVPVFGDGESATENSVIGCNRSLVVENNYGYGGPLGADALTRPGFARIDVRADGSGCDVMWTSDEAAPSVVSKLSVASDAVYSWTKDPDGWAFTAIDFATGRTRFSLPLGNAFGLNNHFAPVSLAQDGTAYVGVVGGLVALRPR